MKITIQYNKPFEKGASVCFSGKTAETKALTFARKLVKEHKEKNGLYENGKPARLQVNFLIENEMQHETIN